MAHDPQWLYVGRRTLMARLLALASSVPVAAIGARSAAAQSAGPPAASAGSFAFGIFGDMPYTRKQEAEYGRVLGDINARDLTFVAHVGDMVGDPRPYERDPTSSRQPATDENYAYVLDTFMSCKHPLILTLGDNDWADVVEFTTVKVDPLERLAKVRSMFFAEPTRSLGARTIALESQTGDAEHKTYVENRMWSIGGVTFATLHIMGSNDNATRTPELVAEHQARKAANMAPRRHPPVPHRQAAVQREDQAAVREFHPRRDLWLAGLALDSRRGRSSQPGSVHLHGADRAGEQTASYVKGHAGAPPTGGAPQRLT
jgi:hypothetical protein